MVEAAQGAALDGLAVGLERIDLDHPAEGVEHVAVVLGGAGGADRGVPALVLLALGRVPAVGVPARFGQAVALERHDLAGAALGVVAGGAADDVEVVLFAGQVGAPGRVAAGAVVVHAEGFGAGGRQLVDQLGVAFGRAAHVHRRGRVHAAVVFGAAHHLHVVAAGLALDLDHAGAVGVDFLVDLGGRALAVHGGAAGGVQAIRLHHVFVVDAQQAAGRGAGVELAVLHAEEIHAVVAVADAALVGLGALVALVAPAGVAKLHRVAQRMQDADLVAGGHGDAVFLVLGDGGKAQALGRRGGRRVAVIVAAAAGRQAHAAQQGRRGGADAALERAAPAQARGQDGVHVFVGRIVDDLVVVVFGNRGRVHRGHSVLWLRVKARMVRGECGKRVTRS